MLNTLDIFPIIWENILMEIPMKVVSEKAKDFKINIEGVSFNKEQEEISALADLKNLLK